MKIGIITMHCPLNYGAVLQTFALQSYLESVGHKVEIIDYRPDYIVYDQNLLYIPVGPFRRNILLKLAYLLIKVPHKVYRKHIFKSFIKKYLHLSSDKYRTYEDLQSCTPSADGYICGSDQIWGYNNEAYKDSSYFLGFVNDAKMCFSYAPSGKIPNPLPKEMIEYCVPLINRLQGVSVREYSSKIALQPYINKPIYHVLDPVFLRSKEDWKGMVEHKKAQSKDYILIYVMGDSEQVIQTAYGLAQKMGLPIYSISGSQRRDKRIDRTICPDLIEFVSLFYNAKVIVTNSFHGTAFSIIFEKLFYVCQTNIASERITSILETCNISSALLLGVDSENIPKSWEYNQQGQNNLKNKILESKEYIHINLN